MGATTGVDPIVKRIYLSIGSIPAGGLAALYNAFIGSGNVRYITLPALAAGVTLTGGKSYAYGAWAEIAASVGASAAWLIGGEISEAAVLGDQYQGQFGTGAGGAETGIATWTLDSRSGSGIPIHYPYPIRIAATTRLAARVANASAGTANTCIIKAALATGVGT